MNEALLGTILIGVIVCIAAYVMRDVLSYLPTKEEREMEEDY